MRSIIEGDRRYHNDEDSARPCFQKQEFKDGQLIPTEEDD